MQLLISDANILIDLEQGGLLLDIFCLPYRFCTPDILFYDELEEHHKHLLNLGLELGNLSSNTLLYAESLIKSYSGPSRYDCFAMALTKQEKCLLITGDKRLRIAAKKEGITVRGTLWIVDRICYQHYQNYGKNPRFFVLNKLRYFSEFHFI